MVYRIVVAFLSFGFRIAAIFGNTKAKAAREGRQSTFSYLKDKNVAAANPIWMHVSSLGEFEQGLPVLEALKKYDASLTILVTFFSPSGYTKCYKHPLLDFVCYLPLDTATNANTFLQLANPRVAIFVKYDFWHFFLKATNENGIPLFLISALFRQDQWFFKPFPSFFKNMLFQFDHIFTQNEASVKLLRSINFKAATKAGDTRIDRVIQIHETPIHFPKIETFLAGNKAIIFGSSWPEDEKVFKSFIHNHPDEKYIIAPHDISAKHIQFLKAMFPSARLYSENRHDTNILIIDGIGMLSRLYYYGAFAYIGGGLKNNIHNTLEPIVFRLPVVFGPQYKKFEEAVWLVQHGGAFVVEDEASCIKTMQQLLESTFRTQKGDQAYQYILKNKGATQQIVHHFIDNNII